MYQKFMPEGSIGIQVLVHDGMAKNLEGNVLQGTYVINTTLVSPNSLEDNYVENTTLVFV